MEKAFRMCRPFTLTTILTALVAFSLPPNLRAQDGGEPVDLSRYANRQVLPDFTAAPCPDNPRGITQIKGNLYRHTTGAGLAVHSGLVLITKDGALVIDPAMTCTAGWLRDEINSRFHVKVKYVAITLGGETVLLHRVAASHSNSMVMVSFPGYKALQCTDVCESRSMPYSDFLDFYYDGWIETLDWVLQQDVDVIDVGHYTPATKEDERALRTYMIDLHQQVLDLIRQGQSWDELYRNVRFSDETKKWAGYDQMRVLNILGMYRRVSPHRRGEW